jgi:phage shock protein A
MPLPPESLPQENQNFLIKQIASGLATTTDLIQSLSAEIRDNSIELATIKADLTNVTENTRSLSRILKEGNGTAPVLSRIAVLEITSKRVEETLDGVEKTLSGIKNSLANLSQKTTELADTKKLNAEDKKGRRQALIAIITSIVALVSAILVALLG